MKIVCEYCDSVVEADNSHNCPFCGASLSGPLLAEIERIKKDQELLEKEEQERKEENEKILDFALALLGSSAGKSIIRKVAWNSIKKNF